MEEINELISPELGSNNTLLWVLIGGLVLAFIYSVLRKLLMPALGTGATREQWDKRLDFLQRVYWPGLVLLLGFILVHDRPVVGAVLFFFVTLIFWHPLRNFFFGILLRVGDTYKVGQRIVFKESRGVIKAFNPLGLEIELDGGGSMDIPYSSFNGESVIRTSPTSGVLSHGFRLTVHKPCDVEREKKRLRSILLSMPYVLPNQKIAFEHLGEDDASYSLKIIAHGLDQEQMFEVENALKQAYGNGVNPANN